MLPTSYYGVAIICCRKSYGDAKIW